MQKVDAASSDAVTGAQRVLTDAVKTARDTTQAAAGAAAERGNGKRATA